MALHATRTAVLGTNATALLDLLRAAAASIVLFGHAVDIFALPSRLPAGLIGVSVFFILSGFLILQSSLARIQRPGPYFAPYLIDRFARIFTAYVPALLLVAGLNAAFDLGRWGQEGTASGPAAFVGNLLLLQNYPLFQVARRLVGDVLYIRPYNSAEPFWTIPIEFWIYVVFGLGFFGLVARERLARPLPVLLGVVALPVAVWNAAAGAGNGLSLVWLVGAATGFVWVAAWHRSTHKLQLGAILGVAAMACLLGRGLKTGWNFQDLGMTLCEALLLLACLSVADGIAPLPQAWHVACAALASYSYSLYLVHNTVLVLARKFLMGPLGAAALPLALLASHGVAFALYWLFERHYRQVGRALKRLARPPGTFEQARPKSP